MVWTIGAGVGSGGPRCSPGNNAKQHGSGLVDWRDGTLDFELAEGVARRRWGSSWCWSTPPTYTPDANRIEWLWRVLGRSVTHAHQRTTVAELLADAQAWAHTITRAEVLGQIGSPFALDHRPTIASHTTRRELTRRNRSAKICPRER